MNTTITIINNQEDIICNQPLYHPRVGSHRTQTINPSHIDAQPRSEARFNEIAYIQLPGGPKAVLIAQQQDGSIRLGGPYVDMIAKELDIETPAELAADKEQWPRAVSEGWPTASFASASYEASNFR